MIKQREEFEDHIRATGVDEYHLAFSDGKYKHMVMQADWCLWQQAQKVAVPDGFVLVPKEPTEKQKRTAMFVIASDGNAIDAYKAMIEAQENST